MLSRFVIAFLPRKKHLLISWLQSPSAVILEPRKIKWATVSPPISHEVMVLDATQSCPILCDPMDCTTPGSLSITNSWSLLKLMSIELVMPSSHLILCRPFFSCPQSLPASESFPMSQLYMRWPKYWSFSFSISPSNEYSRLISIRMDWLDLLAVQGTLKNLLQHHSSKASVLWCLAFFTVRLSHPYMTTGKTIALTRWTFVGKGMALLFNMLSRFVSSKE